MRDAHWVLEQYRQLAGSGETWREVNGRIIDRYEAARARDTLEWAELCAERNREKAEAVARVQTAMSDKHLPNLVEIGESCLFGARI